MNELKDKNKRLFLKNSINIAIAAGAACAFTPSISHAINLVMPNMGYLPLFTSNSVGYKGYMYYKGVSNYILGAGRVYSPYVSHFLSPDRLAPFGDAGVNRYAYRDPINNLDPTGYLSWQAWLGIGLGIVAILLGGVGLVSAIGGISAAIASTTSALSIAKVALATISAISGITSGTLAIASGAISQTNPSTSLDLGLAATVFGVTATLTGLSAFALGKAAKALPSTNLQTASTSGTLAPLNNLPIRVARTMTQSNLWWGARVFAIGRSTYSTQAQVRARLF
ncbi:RHS repeat-associated core domain-containing protein [Vibrio parahaemolyticus]|uniref:RHS repeat-associated core domain-containing protein n=1 Tax=Vibrio parahaemolyticus TaxID=670 RepID=UPI0023629CDA|nr:RHS repeat-associated core domain-containing protein [Vibrio parahaemolyticus]